MDSHRILADSSDKLSTNLRSFPSLDAIRMEDGLFKRNLAYLYEKGQKTERFYEKLDLGREVYFST